MMIATMMIKVILLIMINDCGDTVLWYNSDRSDDQNDFYNNNCGGSNDSKYFYSCPF